MPAECPARSLRCAAYGGVELVRDGKPLAEVVVDKDALFGVKLAADGKSDYQIIVPDNSPSSAIGNGLNQVARLVQNVFKANGCNVPVVKENGRNPAKPGIYLGDTAFARAHGATKLQLQDNYYRSQFKDTAVNWDTAAMRKEHGIVKPVVTPGGTTVPVEDFQPKGR